MVRDPFTAIPSLVSYIAHCWRLFASPTVRFPFARELTQMCGLHYSYPVAVRDKSPRRAKQMCWLHYEQCTQDLVKSVTSLYKHLGLKRFTGAMANTLDMESRLCRQYVTHHRYDLEETCGQTREEFVQQHAAAFELYPEYVVDLKEAEEQSI